MTSSQQDEKLTMELTTEAGHTTTNTAPTRVDRNAVGLSVMPLPVPLLLSGYPLYVETF